MHNSYKIEATLVIFEKPNKNPITLELQLGENIIGIDPLSCNLIIDFPEIDKMQAKISIYEYGECSFESLSEKYDNYKEYEVIPGNKHHIKMRKNKEYDLFNGTSFYISKYKASFYFKFALNSAKISQNHAFMSTFYLPDRDLIEEMESPPKRNLEISNKLDFLPTQALDEPEFEVMKNKNVKKSKEIRNIFKKAVQKIKESIHGKNDDKQKNEKEITDDFLSKFASLYDSMKEEINCSKCTYHSNNSNSNSKGFSTVESPNFLNPNQSCFKSDDQIKIIDENQQDLPNKMHLKQDIFSQGKNSIRIEEMNEKIELNLENNSNNFQNANNSKSLINLNKIKNNDNILNIHVSNENRIMENLNDIKKPIESEILLESILKEDIAELPNIGPTIRESQINAENNLAATMRESQLPSTIRESQLPGTIRESQMVATIRESQMGSTLRESQMPDFEKPDSKLSLKGIPDKEVSLMKNEDKMGKYIRDSKRNSKKRKLDLPELMKIEKKRNFEKKIQDEQFQSLKLFKKENLDDLEDLFEPDTTIKEKKYELNKFQTHQTINKESIDIKNEDSTTHFYEKKDEGKKNEENLFNTKKPKETKKNILEKKPPIEEEKHQNNETNEIHNPEAKKPKLYLTQKTVPFTCNENLILSSKKPQRMNKKLLFEENDGDYDESENLYQIPKIHKKKEKVIKEDTNIFSIDEEKYKKTPTEIDLPRSTNFERNDEKSNDFTKNFLKSIEKKSKKPHSSEKKSSSKSKEFQPSTIDEKSGSLLNKQTTLTQFFTVNEKHKVEPLKEHDNKDSDTEKLSSDKENDKNTEKTPFDFEEQKFSVLQNDEKFTNTKKKESQKNRSNSKKIIPNKKITKTLTQIFSSESTEMKGVLSIHCFGFKPSKAELEILTQLKIDIIRDISIELCDVLIIKKLDKNPTILIAINRGIDIISKQWLDDTLKSKNIQLLDSYHFKDEEFEKNNNFFLDQSILKSKLQGGLFKGYNVWISENKKEFKDLVISAGGNLLKKIPDKNDEKTLIVVCEKKRREILSLADQNINFIFLDLFLESCLKQDLTNIIL